MQTVASYDVNVSIHDLKAGKLKRHEIEIVDCFVVCIAAQRGVHYRF